MMAMEKDDDVESGLLSGSNDCGMMHFQGSSARDLVVSIGKESSISAISLS